MHLTDEKINTTTLDESPVPANGFLTPPDVDDYVEDIINDKRSIKFLKMQDQALKNVQRKVSRCLGPLSQIWDELDKESSTTNIEQVTELIEKTVVLLGQVNTTCL